MIPPCLPLGSRLVHGQVLDVHIELQHVAPRRGPRKSQGQEPRWHPKERVAVCVCVCVYTWRPGPMCAWR